MKQTPRFPPSSFASPTNAVPVSSLNDNTGNRVAVRVVSSLDSESAFAIMHPAAIGLDCHRSPVAVVGEEFGCQMNPRFFKFMSVVVRLSGKLNTSALPLERSSHHNWLCVRDTGQRECAVNTNTYFTRCSPGSCDGASRCENRFERDGRIKFAII